MDDIGGAKARSKLRLILVEDSDNDELLVLRALKSGGYDVSHKRVWTRESLETALDEGGWDAVISDYNMPTFSGPEALAIVKERRIDIPFLIVSGTVGDEDAVRAMRAGAHDYLMKDKLARLAPSLERELRESRGRRDQREANAAAERATHQKELAEAASQTKSLFLANASHELRTPLNAIIGFSEILTSDPSEPLTPRQREYLQHILQSGRHLLMLINDILDLSKVEAGKMDLNFEPTAVDDATRNALDSLAPIAEKKGVHLEIGIAPDLPPLKADPLRFRQMLFNLLSNAIKFTPEGGTVTLRAKLGDGSLQISVTDTGVGIKAEDLPRLFQEFQQLPSSRGVAEGTGLGLALTKRLVEAHGGTIEAASTEGYGATFTIKFPIVGERRTRSGERRAVSPSGLSSAPEKRMVLVVEDDLLSRRLACDVLKARGHHVLEAEDVDQAVAILKSTPPAIVLTDIRIPGGGGERVLRAVRSDPALAAIPVLAATANAMVGARERLIEQGFDEYVSKPLDIQKLGPLVEAFLAKSQA